MKISNKLPQFNGQVALIVSTDKKEAVFYIVTEGFLTSVRTVKADFPKYSDREGFFGLRGRGQTLGTGSVYEKKKQKLEHEFLPQFKKALEEVGREYRVTDLYLFSPAYLANNLCNAIPNKIKAKLRLTIGRNYFGRHPFKLLEKIQAETQKLPDLDKPEIRKILRRRTVNPSGA